MPTITNVEVKLDKNEAKYKKLTLDDKRVVFYVKNTHPRYNELTNGADISDGELELEGKFWKLKEAGKKSYPPKASAPKQDNSAIFTSNSVKTSSTLNKAIELVTALITVGHYQDRGNDPVIIKYDIDMWRKHFIRSWDNLEETPYNETPSDKAERFDPEEDEIPMPNFD